MEQEQTLSDKILDYINSRKVDRLEKFDKETAKEVKAALPENVAAYELSRAELRTELSLTYDPVPWLINASIRAAYVHKATHVAKFTFGTAKKRTNVYFDPLVKSTSGFIDTRALDEDLYDIAVDDAKHSDVSKLVMMEGSDKSFMDLLSSGDFQYFIQFGMTEREAQEALGEFQGILKIQSPMSHPNLKQLYWPVDDEYHLLLPLFPSSLAHKVFEQVRSARASKSAARDQRRTGKHSDIATVDFPQIAVQAFGGTKPQNISQLNSSRGGKAFLVNSAPPQWQSQEKPPLRTKSIFRGPFSRQAYGKTKALRAFLERELHALSTKDIRDERARRIADIVDLLVVYAATVRQFPAGWSRDPECHLPLHQKLWLDPKRRHQDKEFEAAFDQKEWQGEVAADFSRFLNSELEQGKKLAMGDAEFAQWKVLTAQALRLAKEDMQGALDG